jgi:hypothetical protein
MKPPREMTPSEINRALESLYKRSSANSKAFIAAGRGYERPSDYQTKNDPLSVQAREISDRQRALLAEIERRYGPGFYSCPIKHRGTHNKKYC